MSGFDFADRYAEAQLQPTAEIMAARKASAARIQENAEKAQILDLVCSYYSMRPNLDWFRDELRQEDTTFSLLAGARESVLLAALILAAKIEENDPVAILGVVAGSLRGKRTPGEFDWLLAEARSVLAADAVEARVPRKPALPIKNSINNKLTQELTDAASDPAALGAAVVKLRAESQESAAYVARQVTDALERLHANARYQREESQILWWLFGEHSRSLDKPFSAFRPAQVALIGGVELAALTDASKLGPVAASAVLERILRNAKRDTKAQPVTLIGAVDGLGADLGSIKAPAPVRPEICPVLTAIAKASEIGNGAWAAAFNKATGMAADTEFEPIDLAVQVYRECLLGKAE